MSACQGPAAGRMGRDYFMDTGCSSGVMERPEARERWWFSNTGNVLDTAENCVVQNG